MIATLDVWLPCINGLGSLDLNLGVSILRIGASCFLLCREEEDADRDCC